jgi:serine/threonine protein phosphatase PrpC
VNPGSQKILVAANVGDARVVLSRGGQAVQLTFDHKVRLLISLMGL